MDISQTNFLALTALLSCERIFYSVVCHAPSKITSLSQSFGNWKDHEPEFIFKFVHVFKVVQAIAFSAWYYSHFGLTLMALPSVEVCVLALTLFSIGQILNFMVWYRIGVQGVCYGVKFGRNVPWCTQFPFSVMNNPQYSGAILTVWGLFLLASEAAPSDWMMIPAIETMLYIISMKVEY